MNKSKMILLVAAFAAAGLWIPADDSSLRPVNLRAQQLEGEPETLSLSRFPVTNPAHAEACVSLNESRDMVVFQSLRPRGHGGYDLWTSRLADGRWTDPVNAGSGVNTEQHEVDASLSPDGLTMYFTRSAYGGTGAVARQGSADDKGTDLYVSHYRGRRWSSAERIPEPVSLKEAAEFRPVPSPDGKRLYFGSDRAGGHGGYDMWVSDFTDGKWTQPKNLGSQVNTAGDELDAAVAPHGNAIILPLRRAKDESQRLYISRQAGGTWSKPSDMGPRFNTGKGDGCPWLGYDGHTLYVNSQWDRILASQPAARSYVWTFEYSKGF